MDRRETERERGRGGKGREFLQQTCCYYCACWVRQNEKDAAEKRVRQNRALCMVEGRELVNTGSEVNEEAVDENEAPAGHNSLSFCVGDKGDTFTSPAIPFSARPSPRGNGLPETIHDDG